MRPALLAVILLALLVPPARGETPVEAARALVARYHEDRAVLDRARDVLEAALQRERQVETLVALSYVYFLQGDVRATTTEAKLAAYDRGRELGRRAIELAPKSHDAHLWYAINTGRWGQTKGVLRSLFLLPTVREEIDIPLELRRRPAVAGVVRAGPRRPPSGFGAPSPRPRPPRTTTPGPASARLFAAADTP